MPGPYKRKKGSGERDFKRKLKTKRRTKDLDEIDNDMIEENARKLLHQEIDLDKPGSAQFYCLHCARYFIDEHALKEHFRTKAHKRRLKALELEPYTIEESERAAGKGSYQTPKRRKVETQKLDDDEDLENNEDKDIAD